MASKANAEKWISRVIEIAEVNGWAKIEDRATTYIANGRTVAFQRSRGEQLLWLTITLISDDDTKRVTRSAFTTSMAGNRKILIRDVISELKDWR